MCRRRISLAEATAGREHCASPPAQCAAAQNIGIGAVAGLRSGFVCLAVSPFPGDSEGGRHHQTTDSDQLAQGQVSSLLVPEVTGLAGRQKIDREPRDLIRQMSQDNLFWGTPRIRGELLLFGSSVAQATVFRYKMRHPGRSSQDWRVPSQSWGRHRIDRSFHRAGDCFREASCIYDLEALSTRDRSARRHQTPNSRYEIVQLPQSHPGGTATLNMKSTRSGGSVSTT